LTSRDSQSCRGGLQSPRARGGTADDRATGATPIRLLSLLWPEGRVVERSRARRRGTGRVQPGDRARPHRGGSHSHPHEPGQPRSMIGCETACLRLRQPASQDAAFILVLLNEPEFIRNIGDRGVRTLEDARSYIESGPVTGYQKSGFGLYLVELKEDATP